MRELQTFSWDLAGGDITLLPDRGRVLQVTVGGLAAYWRNPAWTGDWNVGGDRLWVAPEVDWHWQTLVEPDFTKYGVPAAVDPGRWQVDVFEPGFCQVRQTVRLRSHHRDSGVTIELTRSFSAVELPETPFFAASVGYGTETELRLVDGTPGQAVGLWTLLQVPPGGEMILAGPRPTPRTLFGEVPRSLRRHQATAARLRITGRHLYKVGLPPGQVTGRLAYAREVGEGVLVIFRQFFPQPWRAYCDRPMHALESQGDAVQVFNDNGDSGGFGELEYHTPALVAGRGPDRLRDSHVTVIGLVPAEDWGPWQRHWLSR